MAELIIKDLVAGYGNVSVLHEVSLEVADGSIVALLGTNGNGKSTLMRCVAGLIKPTAGSITFKDEGAEIDLISDSPKQIVDHLYNDFFSRNSRKEALVQDDALNSQKKAFK